MVGIAHVFIAVGTFAALGCREPVAPEVAAPRLTPGAAMRTLTGGSGTIIFPFDPSASSQVRGDARGLNFSGQVTGTAIELPPNTGDGRPYRWTPGSAAVQIDGVSVGTAWGSEINDAGVIAGTTQNGAGGLRAFYATGNSWVLLDSFPNTTTQDGFTRANAINASGQIVGSAADAVSSAHAVLWSGFAAIQDLGTLGGSSSMAIDINDAGQVIGSSDTFGDASTSFFIWSGSTGMQDLAPLIPNATSLVAINNLGEIAGTFTTSGQSHAFVFSPNTGFHDLGTLGGTSSSATGLNNNGQVVGSSTTTGGATHSFLWTPTDGMEDVTAITGFVDVHALNDNLQTLTGQIGNWGNGANGPQLVQLTVGPTNHPPVAAFTVNCPARQCTFDASTSSDDAGIVRYVWDWGNGRSESHTTPVTRNTFSTNGTYRVTLTVYDASGLTGRTTQQVPVPTQTANQPPTANFTFTCVGQPNPHQCSFDGSTSTDDSGIVASYTWDWGNGRSETRKGSTARNTWASAGTYAVKLTVKDGSGLTGSSTVSVNVP
ncbi:MAG TPA: PKD domain-containing protein [Gemmatimonadaceae bacterium]|jgi:probable HAF family extracellular repeat protein|nr:PKD domain-containing protein [Gemmatimonadaceae bacterium]